MEAYITILGRSTWAVINALHASLEQHDDLHPSIIFIITEDIFKDKIDKVKKGVGIVLDHYGIDASIETRTVTSGAFVAAGREISAIVKELKQNGHRITVDITPGRKSLVAGTLLALARFNLDVDRLLYLDISTIKDVNYPYEMLPRHVHELKDFMAEMREVERNA